MPKFLLDANLSPKTARFLIATFGLDVETLQGRRLGQLPDHEVIRLARATKRVVITLDGDFWSYYNEAAPLGIGVIYLDLPNNYRYVREINRILEGFFNAQAPSIDLEQSFVTVTKDSVTVSRGRTTE